MKKLVVLFMLLLFACDGAGSPRPEASPLGPPEIEGSAISAHADQFEEEVPDRTAGSQQEFAAATYITGHLQQAGYVVEFDAVPVANTVRSTNVVALPPSSDDPTYLVAVAYDEGSDPEAIGAFLEVARALRSRVPDHSVEFVALGAENADIGGGALGSRRMVQLLKDRELEPAVIQIIGTKSEPWAIEGGELFEGEACDDQARSAGMTPGKVYEMCVSTGAEVPVDTFQEAGFERSLIAAPAEPMAAFLLDFLSR